MTDSTVAGSGEGSASASAVNVSDTGPLSIMEAATQFESRQKDDEEPAAGADDTAAAANELAEAPEAEADAAPLDEATGETQGEDPAEKPPLDRPRSWSKEKEAVWTKLDRETQEYLLDHDSEVSKGVRTAQNEAAEARKAIEAERVQLEKARTDYEAKLPALMQALMAAQSSDFPDIKSLDDVQRLATEDPFRYLQWQAHQDKMRAVAFEQDQAATRQAGEQSEKWASYQKDESAKAVQLNPELADPVKSKQLQAAVVDLLRDKGFTDKDLNGIGGGEKYSPFDHRFQSILLDAVKYRAVQKAKPAVLTRPAPQVQRPGAAQPKGALADSSIQALTTRLSSSGSIKDAAALYEAKRQRTG